MMLGTELLRHEGVYHRQLDTDGNLPVSLFLPQSYEPRYAYPLLVFLHGHGERETQWLDALPQLSRRNYIGVGLRGPHPVVGRDGKLGFGWGRNRRSDGAIEDYVLPAVNEIRGLCRIHPQRIFLAGFCEGANLAYRLALSFPQTFAGVVALNGWLPNGPLPLPLSISRLRNGSRPAVFVGHGQLNREVPPALAEDAYRLLYAAGLAVDLRFYPTGHRLTAAMLRDVDHWLIHTCQMK